MDQILQKKVFSIQKKEKWTLLSNSAYSNTQFFFLGWILPKKGTCSSKLNDKHHHRNKHIQISLVFKLHLIGQRQYIECKFELLLKKKNYIYVLGTVESEKRKQTCVSQKSIHVNIILENGNNDSNNKTATKAK